MIIIKYEVTLTIKFYKKFLVLDRNTRITIVPATQT